MKAVKEWVVTIVVALVAAVFLKTFLVAPFLINGASMEPTFQTRDFVLAEKISHRFHTAYAYEDVVIVPITEDKKLIKRVVGVEGDTIEIKDGALIRNGEKVEETYIKEKMVNDMLPVTLKKEEVFVLGDNRNNSSDSRVYGAFHQDDIEGKVILELFNRIHFY